MQEQELGQLGIFRIPVPIPFHQAGGPVNAYVVEDENGILLFDPGIGTVEGQTALAEGLARTRHRFEEVSRIVLSHGHIDHFGATNWVLQKIGRTVPIWIHSADADKVLKSGPDWPELLMQNRERLTKLGLPGPDLEEMVAHVRRDPEMGDRLIDIKPLLPGDKLRCRHVTLEVLHMPGHTPGVCCLYEHNYGLLFSADHLLEHVSPNPLMELGPEGNSFKSLVSYFESIERLRPLAVDLVLPGHAEPFHECGKVMDSLAVFYNRRQAKLLQALRRGPLTVYEAMQELFSPTRTFELFLMLSETLGNLELLEHRGEVEREWDGKCFRFRTP
jgi:glyoxylase-like metal-dependent hydrolase (beta-lactamase superfamily II)